MKILMSIINIQIPKNECYEVENGDVVVGTDDKGGGFLCSESDGLSFMKSGCCEVEGGE